MEAVPGRATPVGLTAGLDASDVASVRLWRVEVPLLRPFVASHGTEVTRSSTLVEATLASGAVGWGECPALARPTYTGEYAAAAWRLLVDELVPALLAGRGEEVRGHPMARSAIEGALLDARLRDAGKGLAAALHPAPARRLARTAVIGARPGDLDGVERAARAAVQAGAALLKVKIEPGWDRVPLGHLRAVLAAGGAVVGLAADANGSYRGVAPAELAFFDELGLRYLEQPYEADDLVGHARLRQVLVATPVALDESVTSAGLVATAAELGALDAVSVKPARLGGLAPSLAVVEVAAAAGLDLFVGGMLELGVGRATAAALAAHPAFALPTDLGPSSQYVADDVTEAVLTDGEGQLIVPTGVGIGVAVRPDRLAATAIDRVELRR